MKKQRNSVVKRSTFKRSKREVVDRQLKNSDLQSTATQVRRKGIGRRQTKSFESKRILRLKNLQRVLANYFSRHSFSLMAIYNVISVKLEKKGRNKTNTLKKLTPAEVSNFLQGEKWLFLKILALMIKDKCISISKMLETNYQQKFLTENVPGTLMFGLCELRSSEGLSDGDECLKLKSVELKSFYIISLLLVGIGEMNQILNHIDYPVQTKSQDQAIEIIFEKIVQKLLLETKLLTSIIFNELVEKWDKIMETIQMHFSLKNSDNVQEACQQRVLKLHAPATSEGIKKILGKASKQQFIREQQQIQSYILSSTNSRQQNRIQAQNLVERSYLPRERDSFEFNDFFGEIFSDQGIDVYLYEQNVMQKVQNISPSNTQEKQISAKQTQTNQVVSRISLRLAQKKLNYKQKYTRDRTRQTIKRRQQQNLQHSLSIQETFEQSSSAYHSEFFSMPLKEISMESSTQNQRGQIIRQDSISVTGDEQSVLQTSTQPNRVPYHNIPHKNREVDGLITQLIEQQMAIARSVANHICHTLDACKIQLMNEQE